MDETPTERARKLRRESTMAERALWQYLRPRKMDGARFRRQHTIGNCFPDFCCIEDRLIIEVDGDTHLKAMVQAKDRVRSRVLRAQGYKVVRFTDAEVILEIDKVLEKITEALRSQRAENKQRNLRPRAKVREALRIPSNSPHRGED